MRHAQVFSMRWRAAHFLVAFAMLPVLITAAEDGPTAQVRAKLQARVADVPNYTCLETSKQSWHTNEQGVDSFHWEHVRVEAGVFNGQKQFAWPGGGSFNEKEVLQLMQRGQIQTSSFWDFLSPIATPITLPGLSPGPNLSAACAQFVTTTSSRYKNRITN